MKASVCVRHVKIKEKTHTNIIVQEAKDKSNEEQLFNRLFGAITVGIPRVIAGARGSSLRLG